jgi:hypothetical protein
MSWSITHLDGSMEIDSDPEHLGSLLDERSGATHEHPEVGVQHESGWALSVFARGRVVWEHVEDDAVAPRHADGLSRNEVLDLMGRVAAGEIDMVETRPWEPGYGR